MCVSLVSAFFNDGYGPYVPHWFQMPTICPYHIRVAYNSVPNGYAYRGHVRHAA
tara:strand:+ start:229 stop:390 length:162 start_codon:yes stop_codon:yes gene_type:complete